MVAPSAGRDRAALAGAAVLGFGFGGLADGIVLHQVLQWHNLVSRVETNETLDGLRRNLFWDGVFHACAALVAAAGVLAVWHACRAGPGDRPVRTLVGGALVGWGGFHAVDQLLFHLVLDLHHIREDTGAPWAYDWGFFAVGVALAAIGLLVLRRHPSRPGAPPPPA